MNTVALTLAGACALASCQAQVRREPTPQQQLLTTCRYEADVREMQGNERGRFITTCLAQGRQREREILKECNLEARGKGGDARRAFLSECSRR